MERDRREKAGRESWKRREELTVSYGRIKASAVATRQVLYQHYRLSLQITRTHGLARNGHVAFDCALLANHHRPVSRSFPHRA